MFDSQDEQQHRPSRDWWIDFALEKVTSVLVTQELRLEDRNGYFTWMWIAGVATIGGTWWRLASGGANQWEALWLVAGAVLIVAGVSLRINGAIELQHIRKLLKLASVGKIPD